MTSIAHMEQSKTPKSEQSIRLLIVDDDPMIRIYVKSILEDLHYHFDEAVDGASALDKLAHTQYALMIVDLNMPGMNGEQLIKQVRAVDKFIGLIVLTSESNINVSFRLLEQYGISDYILKTIFETLPLQLQFSIKNSLNRRHFLIQQANYISNLEYLKTQAEEAKSHFLTQMNHELNTPMNAILGFGQLLDNMDLGLTAKPKNYVKQIVNAGWTLTTLIEKILKMSSVEFDILKLKSEPVDLMKLVDDLIHHFGPAANSRSITWHNKCGSEQALADNIQVRAIVYSMINNAIIYNKDNGTVTISTEIKPTNTIRLNIIDSGQGIDSSKIAQLFTPFNRLGVELKTISGAGVSLALAKRLITAMHGNIGCDSTVDQGSTFWIELPLTQNVNG